MNIAEKIKSYYWIITTIKMCGPITLKDLNNKWIRHNNQWQNLDRNTFRTYRENIEDIFGIKISYTRNGYCLDDPIAIKAHSYQELLTRHVQDIDFYIKFKDLGDKLQTDDIPGGADYLNTIGKALTDNLRMRMQHQKFADDISKHLIVEPYCIKTKDRRWYLLARNVETGKMRTYALDRILNIELTEEHFTPDSHIDISNFYSNCLGVYANDESLSEVIIKVSDFQAKYLRTLPLHSSQTEIAPYVFQYRVDVTPDLVNEILKMGSNATVIQPESLRQTVKDEIEKMSGNYRNSGKNKSIV